MSDRLPLSTLLSHALIAHTIEFDNEFEQRAPHATTVTGGGVRPNQPWLTSRAMWTNFLRFVESKGTPVRIIQAQACLSENAITSRLHHLEWWKYLTFALPVSATKTRYRDMIVQLTPGGRRAADEWQPLPALIDKRWRARFGKNLIDPMVASLRRIDAAGLPDYMPVVDYQTGFRATLTFDEDSQAIRRTPADKLDISGLLSRALLSLTLEFEDASDASLTNVANVMRPLGQQPMPFNQLPLAGGIAREQVTVAVNFLKKNKLATQGADKTKLVKLTAKGTKTLESGRKLLEDIEKRWQKEFGTATIKKLRSSLEAMTSKGKSGRALLAEGIQPPADCWRSQKPYIQQTEAFLRDPRANLPHHPLISHRGGFPDGA